LKDYRCHGNVKNDEHIKIFIENEKIATEVSALQSKSSFQNFGKTLRGWAVLIRPRVKNCITPNSSPFPITGIIFISIP